MLNQIKKTNKFEFLLLFLFCLQFLVLCYFNVSLIDEHMSYDSSWSFLKAALIWREKSINSPIWIDQTNTFIDSSMPLAALLYGISGNLFVSYGISNIIVLSLILLCLYRIFKLMSFSNIASLISINLVICPYTALEFTQLGYFNDLLSGPAFYNLRTLVILLFIYELLFIKANKKFSLCGFLSLPLFFICGISSGIFIIIMILFPFLIYALEIACLQNSLKYLKSVECIYTYMSTLLVIVGKALSSSIVGSTANDSDRTWTTLEKIYLNFGAVLQGLMKLIQVLPVSNTEVKVMSKDSLSIIFALVIFGIIILSLGYAFKELRKHILVKDTMILFLLNIVLINFISFGLFNVQYGSALFEERYLISTYIILLILLAYFVNSLSTEQLYSKAIIIITFISILGIDIISDKVYIIQGNDYTQLNEVLSTVKQENAELIYFWGDELVTLGRQIRVMDLDHVYKEIASDGNYLHWGDYTYYEKNEDYSGKTLLVTAKDNTNIPTYYLNQYTLIKESDTLYIYSCPNNPINVLDSPIN